MVDRLLKCCINAGHLQFTINSVLFINRLRVSSGALPVIFITLQFFSTGILICLFDHPGEGLSTVMFTVQLCRDSVNQELDEVQITQFY